MRGFDSRLSLQGNMSKTKRASDFPSLFRLSDRSSLLLASVFVVALGVAVGLASFGKSLGDEFSRFSPPKSFFELKLRALIFGHPIDRMSRYILAEDREVAMYLVAIAKKESNWGKFAPEKDGKTCFNYWGYRGPENTTDSGYSCFRTPAEAVSTVGRRIRELLDQGVDTPREFVVWKRGFLDTPLDSSEEKWVSDVAYYVAKFSSRKN